MPDLVEVSRPDITFERNFGIQRLLGTFDTRLLSQAFGNLIKNAAEGIDAAQRAEGVNGVIRITAEQAEQLASMNKDWMNQDEDKRKGQDEAQEVGGDEWTEDDLRREEEETRQMEAKKRELQARLKSMEKDLGGLRNMYS